MKVILLQDVAKIGRKHAVVNVPDGYGQNQLIPKGLAKPATSENLKSVEQKAAENKERAARSENRFFEAKEALKNNILTLNGLKNDNGHLFAAIKPEAIIAAAKAQNIELDSYWISIKQPLKTTGEHSVGLSHEGHRFEFKINIQ